MKQNETRLRTTGGCQRVGGGGGEKYVIGVRRYKPPVIKQISQEDVMYCTRSLVNNIAITLYGNSSVQLLICVHLFANPMDYSNQASLSITNSQSLLKFMYTELMTPSTISSCRPLLLLPPIPSSIRVFSNESTLCMRWPKYWRFSLSISPSNEYSGLISFRID